jgi:tRNA nucleotidyltransferase/poly(A) polymerase
MTKAIRIPGALHDLRQHFVANGFDLRLVGGCVRDHLLGLKPKDFDLCTDAAPNEQRQIFETYRVRHITTGLQHGTYTVVLDNTPFEITSLRTDSDCDGRHATVIGVKPGKPMGLLLATLKAHWATNDYTLSKDDILRILI